MKKEAIFKSSSGNQIALNLYFPEQSAPTSCILYLHGFKGFKDWGFVPFSGEYFSCRGFIFVAMNFSHNGIGIDPFQMTEEKNFEENTFSLELKEAEEMIDAIVTGKIHGIPENISLGLIGHSRGGGIALLAGMRNKNVKAISTWAAVSYFNRYDKEIIDRWKQNGYLEILNQRTGQILRLGWTLHENLMANIQGSLNIRNAVEQGNCPLCIIHGKKDEAVSFADAENLFNWAGSIKSKIYPIEDTGHTFGAVHPFTKTTTALNQVLQHSFDFFSHLLHPVA